MQAWKHLRSLGAAARVAAYKPPMYGDVFSYLGKCPKCGEPQRRDATISKQGRIWQDSGEVVEQRVGDPTLLRAQCRRCNAYLYMRQIHGSFNPEVVCTPRCMASTGPNCECSCGGANHGKAYA